MDEHWEYDLRMREKELKEFEESRPKCCMCDAPIYEWGYRVEGEIYCEECMDSMKERFDL